MFSMRLQGTLMALWLNKWLKVYEGSGQRDGPDKLFYSISLSILYNGKESGKEYIHLHTYIVYIYIYAYTLTICRYIIAKYIYICILQNHFVYT